MNGPQNASAIIQGCMRMPSLSAEEAAEVIRTAYECGINFFDHATCYGMGEAEERFAQAFPLTGIKREKIFLQSKCGICPERSEFDWTKENILSSVDDSLRRLNIEYLDTLLLHRPDVLYDTINHAKTIYFTQPDRWHELVERDMNQNNSWENAAKNYEALYDSL